MDCPRCGAKAVAQDACPRCGVVFAKLQAPRARPPARPAPQPPPAGGPSPLVTLLGLVALVLAAAVVWRWSGSAAPGAPAAAQHAARDQPEGRPAPVPGPDAQPPAPQPGDPTPPPASFALSRAERDLFDELHERVSRNGAFGDAEVSEAEGLFASHPEEQGVQRLLGDVLLSAGTRDARNRKLDAAEERLRRAQLLLPGDGRPLAALLGVLLDNGDWAGAEATARELLTLERHPRVLEHLAYALFRQDRNREAAQLLHESLELGPSASARSLLDRIVATGGDEQGMTERQLSHFHVRYDGDAHEDVGREILRVLERHYATLAGTLDHQPAAPIPVILFSRQQYYSASGAPAWSGGVYEPMDGRIRIPIGGLTTSLSPELEDVLIHEVTHAFVGDRSRDTCPRDVHEGLAQYMEGKRIAELLKPEQTKALADGRIGGVAGSYLLALSFVEYLMGARGQGGINDLLRQMGETRDVDEAFRRVYGSDLRATRNAWLVRLRQQHGS
jgi:tetratricopeptide (TPR) repeat protein